MMEAVGEAVAAAVYLGSALTSWLLAHGVQATSQAAESLLEIVGEPHTQHYQNTC